MKNIFTFTFFMLSILYVQSQKIDYNNLPPEFQDVAMQAMNKLSPANRQWFADISRQHPAGSFDSLWTKNALLGKFSAADNNKMGDLWMVMMAYQKMLNKESREDKKLSRADVIAEVKLKNEKLESDKIKIDQMKKEADERYDHSMTTANKEMAIGIVSTTATQTASTGQTNTINQVTASDKLRLDSINRQKQITLIQNQKTKAGLSIENSNEKSKETVDHRKAMQDAIKKLLDQLAEMQRSANL
jgi:hypothetical protein